MARSREWDAGSSTTNKVASINKTEDFYGMFNVRSAEFANKYANVPQELHFLAFMRIINVWV